MLEKAAKSADDAAAEIRKNGTTLVSNMQAQANGLVGETGTAFRNVLGDLMGDLSTILTKLENLAGDARTSANKLTAQDESGAAGIKKVSHGPGGGAVTTGLT
jgi:uncharacterized protein YukE